MLGQPARKLREVGTRFSELSRPTEARRRVPFAQCLHDFRQLIGIDPAEYALGVLEPHVARAGGDHLLERVQRVAHPAAGMVCNQVKRIALELKALVNANGA